MIYILSGVIIFGTHYLFKENQWLLQRKLWQLITTVILCVGITIIISTWLGSLLPTIITTLVCGTLLQIKYTQQIASQKFG